MWITFDIAMLVVIGLPSVWVWLWRSKFLPKNYSGMRLENLREQSWLYIKRVLPIWGLMLLIAIDSLVELHPVSRRLKDFWLGFMVASTLFLMGFMVVNLVTAYRRVQEKRQRRSRNLAGPELFP